MIDSFHLTRFIYEQSGAVVKIYNHMTSQHCDQNDKEDKEALAELNSPAKYQLVKAV